MIPEKIQNKVNEIVEKRRDVLIKKKERLEEEILNIFNIFSFTQITSVKLCCTDLKLTLTCTVSSEENEFYYEMEKVMENIQGDDLEGIIELMRKLNKIPVSDFNDIKKWFIKHEDDEQLKFFNLGFNEYSIIITISEEL